MRNIVIYGAGTGGRYAYELLCDRFHVVAFADSYKHSSSFIYGIPVIRPGLISCLEFDYIYIASMYLTEILLTLKDIGVPDEKVRVYETTSILIDKRMSDVEKFIFDQFGDVITHSLNGSDLQALNDRISQNAAQFNTEQCLLIYDYLMLNRMFASAMDARKKASKNIVDDERRLVDEKIYSQYILSNFDQGTSSRVYNEVLSMAACRPKWNLINQQRLQVLVEIGVGNLKQARATAYSLFSDSDRHFMKFFEGARIAIVGPCEPQHLSGAEIDGFDCVVRLSSAPVSELNKHTHGSKTDLVYISAHSLNYMHDIRTVLSECTSKRFVFGSIQVPSQQDLIDRGLARMMINGFKLFNGSPNFLQRILLDILLIIPADIKIFNFDFYTGNEIYGAEYRDSMDLEKYSKKGDDSLLQSQTLLHDFVSQFNFTKLLYEKKMIEADMHSSKLLNESAEHYIEQLSV